MSDISENKKPEGTAPSDNTSKIVLRKTIRIPAERINETLETLKVTDSDTKKIEKPKTADADTPVQKETVKPVTAKITEVKKEDLFKDSPAKEEEPKKEEPKKEEPKKEEPKKEEPKKAEPKKEEPKKEEPTPVKAEKRNSNFLVQGSILAIASIISRFIGLLYRIPMTEIIGDVGNSYYACAYDVYNVMLIISSYSLPLAVSKLVSARMADDNKPMAYKVFKGALLFALGSGSLVALIVWFGADFFASTLLKTPMSVFALRILAPVLVVVAVLGVIRGFFQGMGNMVYSALSQIIEQIVNAIVSVAAAYYLYQVGAKVGRVLNDVEHYSAAYGAAGGTLGTNMGSVAGLIFMLIVLLVFLRQFRRDMALCGNKLTESMKEIMFSLISTIIPVLLSTTIYNISGIIDQAIFKNVALLQGFSSEKVDVWWGVFAGKYKLLINVPLAIANAMAASSVPALTRSFKENKMDQVREQIAAVTRFVMVIAFPCAVGLSVLGKPIVMLLFPSSVETAPIAGMMFLIGGIAVVFYAMSTLSNGLLQGIDRLRVPVRNACIALVAHVMLLVILMLTFRMHIYAVVIANAAFALIMCVLNSNAIALYAKYRQEFYKTFILPAACSIMMGLLAWAVYQVLYLTIKSNAVSFLAAFVVAVIVYTVLLLLMKGLTEEEILKFPKGTLLVKLFKKVHLL